MCCPDSAEIIKIRYLSCKKLVALSSQSSRRLLQLHLFVILGPESGYALTEKLDPDHCMHVL